MRTKKAALGFAPREAASESSPRQPRSLEEPDALRHSTAPRPRGPFPHRSFRALVRHGLLGTFLDLGSAPVSLADARARRAAALLVGESPADEEQERRAWNDRRRAS
jgi:hypothetical protein